MPARFGDSRSVLLEHCVYTCGRTACALKPTDRFGNDEVRVCGGDSPVSRWVAFSGAERSTTKDWFSVSTSARLVEVSWGVDALLRACVVGRRVRLSVSKEPFFFFFFEDVGGVWPPNCGITAFFPGENINSLFLNYLGARGSNLERKNVTLRRAPLLI